MKPTVVATSKPGALTFLVVSVIMMTIMYMIRAPMELANEPMTVILKPYVRFSELSTDAFPMGALDELGGEGGDGSTFG